jgi:hypothetical protein
MTAGTSQHRIDRARGLRSRQRRISIVIPALNEARKGSADPAEIPNLTYAALAERAGRAAG